MGLNPFSSTRDFDATRQDAQLQTELIPSLLTLSEGVRQCVRVASVKAALTQKIRELKRSRQLLETSEFGGKILVAIGGDKGGTSTKLTASIINSAFACSVRNLIVIGMYEGRDDAENLRIAFDSFGPELEALTSVPVPETSEEDSPEVEVPVEMFWLAIQAFLEEYSATKVQRLHFLVSSAKFHSQR